MFYVVLGLFFSENIISEDIIEKVMIKIKKQDLSKLIKAHTNTIPFLVYLSKCDEELEITIKKIILQSNPFPTGISDNGKSRSFGGGFALLNISFTYLKIKIGFFQSCLAILKYLIIIHLIYQKIWIHCTFINGSFLLQ